MAAAARFVLDTSAVLALRGDEGGADRVAALLRAVRSGRSQVMFSFMTRMEVLYIVTAEEDEAAAHDALRLLDATGVSWISCETTILLEAARIKSGGKLSVADAWIAATAAVHDATLVHKDPEFRRLTHVRQEVLPR